LRDLWAAYLFTRKLVCQAFSALRDEQQVVWPWKT